MAKLIYAAITSLDGYIEDQQGNFDWAMPDDEVHAFVNDLLRPIGTHLYGRRMYQVMAGWDSMDTLPDQEPITLDFAQLWQAADKIVYSRTQDTVSTAKTQIERKFNVNAVERLKQSAERDLSIGGPGLAAEALRAGLVDEIHLIISPIVVGGGKPALPDDIFLKLELLDERRFGNGVVHLHYRIRT